MRKRMNISARKPNSVVTALAAMEAKDWRTARRMASCTSSVSVRKRSKLLSRKMA